MLHEIVRRGKRAEVLFSAECKSLRECVEMGLRHRGNLAFADLSGVDLSGVDFTEADLQGVDFIGANLSEAILVNAELDGADFTNALLVSACLMQSELHGADFTDAVLVDADLQDADAVSANFTRANLTGADFERARLDGACFADAVVHDVKSLQPVRDDLWAKLSARPREVAALRTALAEGRVDGTGDVPCMGHGDDNWYPAIESFLCSVRPGHTPDNSQHVNLALAWVDQWIANVSKLFHS